MFLSVLGWLLHHHISLFPMSSPNPVSFLPGMDPAGSCLHYLYRQDFWFLGKREWNPIGMGMKSMEKFIIRLIRQNAGWQILFAQRKHTAKVFYTKKYLPNVFYIKKYRLIQRMFQGIILAYNTAQKGHLQLLYCPKRYMRHRFHGVTMAPCPGNGGFWS